MTVCIADVLGKLYLAMGLIASPGSNGVRNLSQGCLNDGLIRVCGVVMKTAGESDWQIAHYESS